MLRRPATRLQFFLALSPGRTNDSCRNCQNHAKLVKYPMSIPFRDADDLDELGTVAYLKIEPVADGSGYLGGLFLINARGEPIEFTYNRIDTPNTFLWRQEDLRRHAARKLTASLFSLCPRTPRLLLCLAQEVGSELFCQDLQVSIPVCRIALASEVPTVSAAETKEVLP